jgi:hypothetical protein
MTLSLPDTDSYIVFVDVAGKVKLNFRFSFFRLRFVCVEEIKKKSFIAKLSSAALLVAVVYPASRAVVFQFYRYNSTNNL